MRLDNIEIEESRRMIAQNLSQILKDLPLQIKGPCLKIRSRVGLGGIIYMEAYEGLVTDVRLGEFTILPSTLLSDRKKYLSFQYKDNIYDFSYYSRTQVSHRRLMIDLQRIRKQLSSAYRH